MSNLEYCWFCDEVTGGAGRGEDSLYDTNDGGPYCSECFDKLVPDLKGESDED